MEKLTILGDSLALPRADDGIFIEDTYPYLIQKCFNGNIYVVNRARAGNDSRSQAEDLNVKADVVVAQSGLFAIQLGIVDCAPRIFTTWQRALIQILLGTQFAKQVKEYIERKTARRFELTKQKPIVVVSLEEFERNISRLLLEIFQNNDVHRLFILNIAYPGEIMQRNSYGILANIQRYNDVLLRMAESDERCRVIDVYTMTKNDQSLLLPDGHHLQAAGHRSIAEQISQDLASYLAELKKKRLGESA